MLSPLCRAASRTGVALLLLLLAAARSRGADVPPNTRLRVDAPITPTKFQRSFNAQFPVQLRKVVAADIDRDGDLDVVATTEQGLIVWLNDGAGHLTLQAPQYPSALGGRSPDRTAGGNEPHHDEPVQNSVSSGSVLTRKAHSPPLAVRLHVFLVDTVVRLDTTCRCSSPRAPPSQSALLRHRI